MKGFAMLGPNKTGFIEKKIPRWAAVTPWYVP